MTRCTRKTAGWLACAAAVLGLAMLTGCGGSGGSGGTAPQGSETGGGGGVVPSGVPGGVPGPLLAAPTGIVATPGDGQVTLTWPAVDGATAYDIYRSTGPGAGIRADSTRAGSSSLSYTDTSVTNGTTYYYAVAAASPGGVNPPSSESSATPGVAPNAPSGLAARPGVASTALIWTPAAGAGSYNLYFTTLPPADVTGTQIQGVTSPFTHAGLASGRTVYYVVTAVSQAGVESTASPEASATPPSATVGAPGGVVAAAPGGTAGTASVTWTAPAGGAAPSGYAIYRSTAPVTPFNATLVGVVQAPPAGPPPLAYTDATAGGPVYYAVAAFDANGEGAFSPSSAPVNVSHSATAVISPGHTCAVLDNSAVKCWGYNSVGEPGSGSLGNIGYAAGQMGSLLPFVSLGTGRTAAAIAAGFNHTCVLLDDRTVKCWGDNAHGQLGQGDTASRGAAFSDMGDGLIALDFGPAQPVSAIAGGGYHTCVILEDRTVRCWGYNAFGQLGLGDAQDRGDNPGEMAQFLPPVNLGTGHTAKAVSAGGYHACAILEDGSVKCWGSNFYGQLGLGDVKNRGDVPGGMGAALAAVNLGTNGQGQAHTAKAVSAGGFHTCAILDDDSVKCWGQNAVGQLGLDDTANRGIGKAQMGDRLPAVNLGVGLTAASIAAGYVFTCAILSDASTKCWGDNSYGQLGQGDTVNRGNVPGSMAALPPIALGAGGQTAAALSTNAGYHVCAALSDLTVKCWGLNLYGQLGLGDAVDRGDSAGTSVSASPAVDLGSN